MTLHAAAATLLSIAFASTSAMWAQQTPPVQPTAASSPSASAAAPSAPVVSANPALWIVKGPHTTIYLFGTVHIMRPNVDWHSAKVTAAIDASQSLMEEIPDMDKPPAIQAEVVQLGTDPEHPLSTKLTKEDVARTDAAVKQMGLPGESAFEPMRPWLVSVTLSTLPLLKAGFDPASGVDVTLAREFRAKGKSISGLETVDQQLHFLADMPQEEQVAELHEQLQHLDSAQADLLKVIDGWQKGDVDTIAAIENGDFMHDYPELYHRLVVERNARWADRIGTLLSADGPTQTIFLAVGAAHLAGPDSVQKMLATRGFTVTAL